MSRRRFVCSRCGLHTLAPGMNCPMCAGLGHLTGRKTALQERNRCEAIEPSHFQPPTRGGVSE